MMISRIVLPALAVLLAATSSVRSQVVNITQVQQGAAAQAQAAAQAAQQAQNNATDAFVQQAQAQAAAAQREVKCLSDRFGNGTEFAQRTQACAAVPVTKTCSAGCINILNSLSQSCRNTLAGSAVFGASFQSLFDLCGVGFQVTRRPPPPPFAAGLVLPSPPPPTGAGGTGAAAATTTAPTAAPVAGSTAGTTAAPTAAPTASPLAAGTVTASPAGPTATPTAAPTAAPTDQGAPEQGSRIVTGLFAALAASAVVTLLC